MGHLKDVNETYLTHCRHALVLSSRLLVASLGQALHALVPDVHPPLGSDVRSLISFLESKLPENRK
jgi:hypothetical protein